jgi:hypothetical protein
MCFASVCFPPFPRGNAVIDGFSCGLLRESVREWIQLFRTFCVYSSLLRFLTYRLDVFLPLNLPLGAH